MYAADGFTTSAKVLKTVGDIARAEAETQVDDEGVDFSSAASDESIIGAGAVHGS